MVKQKAFARLVQISLWKNGSKLIVDDGRIHGTRDRYVYLATNKNIQKSIIHVGKYTRPMDPMGYAETFQAYSQTSTNTST